MASAEFACGQILFGLKQSKLNYVLNETPYSAYITIRKKFLKISKEEENYNIEDRTDTSSEKDVIIKSLVEKNKTLEILIASAKVEYEELCLKIDLLEKNNLRNEDIIENYIKKDKIKTDELDCIRKVNECLKSDIANICNIKDVTSSDYNAERKKYLEAKDTITIQEHIIENNDTEVKRLTEKLKKNSEVINKEDSDKIKIKIKEHEETNLETTEEYYTCPQCSDRCDSVNPVIKCNECDFIVCSEFCIDNHNGMMHTFECYYCQSVFKTGKELDTHKEKYHTFPCYQCDFIGCSKAYLAKHMVEKHTETTQTEHIYNEE